MRFPFFHSKPIADDDELLPRGLRIAEAWGMELEYLVGIRHGYSVESVLDDWDLLTDNNRAYLYGLSDKIDTREELNKRINNDEDNRAQDKGARPV